LLSDAGKDSRHGSRDGWRNSALNHNLSICLLLYSIIESINLSRDTIPAIAYGEPWRYNRMMHGQLGESLTQAGLESLTQATDM